jgi:hypothetical protein
MEECWYAGSFAFCNKYPNKAKGWKTGLNCMLTIAAVVGTMPDLQVGNVADGGVGGWVRGPWGKWGHHEEGGEGGAQQLIFLKFPTVVKNVPSRPLPECSIKARLIRIGVTSGQWLVPLPPPRSFFSSPLQLLREHLYCATIAFSRSNYFLISW